MDLGNLNWSVEVDTSDLSRAEREMEGTREAAEGARRATEGIGTGAQRAASRTRTASQRMERDMQRVRRSTDMLRNAVGGLVAALSVREVIRYADAWQSVENQIRMVTGSTQELERVQQQVVAVARETRANFSATGNLYARLARSTTELNLAQSDLLDLTRTINQSFAVSGATAEEASAAITQLSQGLAAGALRGDEFNSVAEQAPAIMRAISESLGMTIGELRDFAAEGGITAEIVVTALQEASDSIADDFAGSVATFGQQLEVARTNLIEWAGQSSVVRDAVSGVGNTLINVTSALSSNVGAINAAIGALGGAAAAYIALQVALVSATVAQRALNAAMRVNPFVAAASAIAAVTGALYASRDATIELGNTQATLAEWMQGTWKTVSDGISDAVGGAMADAGGFFGEFGSRVGEVAQYMWGTFEALLGNIVRYAKVVVNSVIGYFMTLRDTMGIVARTIRDQFRMAFENILDIAAAFWEDLKGVFSGDLDFSAFRSAVREGIIEPLAGAGAEIQAAFRENFSVDYVGESIMFVGDAIQGFKEDVVANVRVAGMEFKTLDEWLFKTGETADTVTDPAFSGLGESTSETSTEVASLSDELGALRRRLQPGYADAERFARGLNTVNLALAAGRISMGEYAELVQLLQREMQGADDSIRDLGDTNADTTDEMSREWERFGNSVDETFKDAFKGAFDSFEDFADQLKGAFENLLAELAYAAVKNEIRIQLGIGTSGPMQGGISDIFGGGGFGGIGSIAQGADRLFGTDIYGAARNVLGLGGSLGAAGTAATGYAGAGWASSVATGGYTGWAGSAAAGSTAAGGGFMSGLSAAAPWIAGGLAIDNILGLGIVDGIVDGVSSALGISGKYAGENPTGLIATRNSYGSAGREGWERDAFATGALGDIGFAPDSRDIDTLFGERDNFENAKRYAEQLAQMDNIVAQLASSEEELAEMRRVAAEQGLTDMSDIEDRYRAVLGSLGEEFDAYVDTLDGDLGEIVQQAVTAGQAFNVMSDAAERLNLQFDASASGAYETAAALAEAAGGIENLAAVQQGYYQAVYSETERLQHQIGDLTASLSGVTDTMPTTVAELRSMVEAADLSTDAGQELALQLMQLAPALAQTSDAVERALTEAYQEHLDRAPDAAGLEYWMDAVVSGATTLEQALEDIANSTEAASIEAEASAQRYRDTLTGLLDDLDDAIGARRSDLRDQLDARKDAIAEERDAVLAGIDAQRDALDARRESYQETYQLAQDALSAEMDLQREAWDARRKMMQEELSAAQEALSVTEGLAGSLSRAMGSLVQRTPDQQMIDYQRAQGALSSMLDSARGGALPEQDALDRALSGVADPAMSQYASREDMLRDTTRTAHIVGELSALTEDQLSADEQAVAALESRLVDAERQHSQSMAMLEAQMDANEEAHEAEMRRMADQIDALTLARTQAQEHFALEQERAQAQHDTEIERLDRLYAAAERQVNAALGIDSSVRSVRDAIGALAEALTGDASVDGSHASGLMNVPFDGYRAELHKGEMVVPAAPAEIIRSGGGPRLDMSEVVNELKAVKGELAYSKDIQRTMAKRMTQMQRVIDDWDRRGQPETREQPA